MSIVLPFQNKMRSIALFGLGLVGSVNLGETAVGAVQLQRSPRGSSAEEEHGPEAPEQQQKSMTGNAPAVGQNPPHAAKEKADKQGGRMQRMQQTQGLPEVSDSKDKPELQRDGSVSQIQQAVDEELGAHRGKVTNEEGTLSACKRQKVIKKHTDDGRIGAGKIDDRKTDDDGQIDSTHTAKANNVISTHVDLVFVLPESLRGSPGGLNGLADTLGLSRIPINTKIEDLECRLKGNLILLLADMERRRSNELAAKEGGVPLDDERTAQKLVEKKLGSAGPITFRKMVNHVADGDSVLHNGVNKDSASHHGLYTFSAPLNGEKTVSSQLKNKDKLLIVFSEDSAYSNIAKPEDHGETQAEDHDNRLIEKVLGQSRSKESDKVDKADKPTVSLIESNTELVSKQQISQVNNQSSCESAVGLETEECGIECQICAHFHPVRNVVDLPCCKQELCRKCVGKIKGEDGMPQCPFCRARPCGICGKFLAKQRAMVTCEGKHEFCETCISKYRQEVAMHCPVCYRTQGGGSRVNYRKNVEVITVRKQKDL